MGLPISVDRSLVASESAPWAMFSSSAATKAASALVQAGPGHGRDHIRRFDRLVGARRPRHVRDGGRQFVVVPGVVAAKLVHLAFVTFAHQDDRGPLGVVGTGSAGHTTLAGGGHQNARLSGGLHRLRVVLGVPVVAKHGVRQARGLEVLLSGLVLGRENEREVVALGALV